MIIQGNIEVRARDISSAIQEYLEKEELTVTNSTDVIDYLIEKDVLKAGKKKKHKAQEFENILNQLSHMNREKLIKGLRKDIVKRKTVWYFDKV